MDRLGMMHWSMLHHRGPVNRRWLVVAGAGMRLGSGYRLLGMELRLLNMRHRQRGIGRHGGIDLGVIQRFSRMRPRAAFEKRRLLQSLLRSLRQCQVALLLRSEL